MARGKRESGVARGADLWTKGGDYQRPLQGQKTVWFARERKVRPEGEEGELRDKKAAASRFKLFLSLVRQRMDSALEDGSMASGGWLLRITVRSTAAFWPWRSQANLVGRASPHRVSARRRQAWNVMPVLEKVLWRFFGPRLAPTHT
jgi:hypothetical protein